MHRMRGRARLRPAALLASFALLAALFAPAGRAAAPAAGSSSVRLEELTSPELRQRIAAGSTTLLLPIGGTEQNGPHMVLGKHNLRARVLAERIAVRLGNAIVAPVLAYVPEGSIDPPAAHMRFAGTVSIPEPVFEALLDAAARSFRRHGFRDVVFLGDHGGYQSSLQRVAARLNGALAGAGPFPSRLKPPRGAASEARVGAVDAANGVFRVHALPEYYGAAQTAFVEALKQRGFGDAEIGTHAGLADTALALAVDRSVVRVDALAALPARSDGVSGDPRRATPELGELGLQRIVESSVATIRAATAKRAR